MRAKVLRIPLNVMLRVLYEPQPQHGMNLPDLQLPEGYTVSNASYDWIYKNLEVLIEHPSFEEVPQGGRPPCINWVTKYKFVNFASPAELEKRREEVERLRRVATERQVQDAAAGGVSSADAEAAVP